MVSLLSIPRTRSASCISLARHPDSQDESRWRFRHRAPDGSRVREPDATFALRSADNVPTPVSAHTRCEHEGRAGPARRQRPQIRQVRVSAPSMSGSGRRPSFPRLQGPPLCLLVARSAAACKHAWLSLAWASSDGRRRPSRCWSGRAATTSTSSGDAPAPSGVTGSPCRLEFSTGSVRRARGVIHRSPTAGAVVAGRAGAGRRRVAGRS